MKRKNKIITLKKNILLFTNKFNYSSKYLALSLLYQSLDLLHIHLHTKQETLFLYQPAYKHDNKFRHDTEMQLDFVLPQCVNNLYIASNSQTAHFSHQYSIKHFHLSQPKYIL